MYTTYCCDNAGIPPHRYNSMHDLDQPDSCSGLQLWDVTAWKEVVIFRCGQVLEAYLSLIHTVRITAATWTGMSTVNHGQSRLVHISVSLLLKHQTAKALTNPTQLIPTSTVSSTVVPNNSSLWFSWYAYFLDATTRTGFQHRHGLQFTTSIYKFEVKSYTLLNVALNICSHLRYTETIFHNKTFIVLRDEKILFSISTFCIILQEAESILHQIKSVNNIYLSPTTSLHVMKHLYLINHAHAYLLYMYMPLSWL